MSDDNKIFLDLLVVIGIQYKILRCQISNIKGVITYVQIVLINASPSVRIHLNNGVDVIRAILTIPPSTNFVQKHNSANIVTLRSNPYPIHLAPTA